MPKFAMKALKLRDQLTLLKPIPSRNNLLIPDSIHVVADNVDDYEMIHVDRLQEP